MWKKTAMVTESEAASLDCFIQQYAEQDKRLTRSDVVRIGTLALITEHEVLRCVVTDESWTKADTARTVRIAGVFTYAEFQRVVRFATSTKITFSTLLREGMLAVLTGRFQLGSLPGSNTAEEDNGGA